MSTETPKVTIDSLDFLANEAYRRCGYQTVRFKDGSRGILKCPAKTITLMNTFAQLVLDKFGEAAEG